MASSPPEAFQALSQNPGRRLLSGACQGRPGGGGGGREERMEEEAKWKVQRRTGTDGSWQQGSPW